MTDKTKPAKAYATLRAIGTISPYGKNAKKHPDDQVLLIANSIKEFGFNQPIVVDTAGVVIVGHGRLQAAQMLGLEMVPVVVVDLTDEQARSYRLADNRLNESEWDMALVTQELRKLSAPMVDLSGFGDLGINLDPSELADTFSLNDNDRSGFQQMTFSLSDAQADMIKNALKDARLEDGYDTMETDGNENKNGLALSYIIKSWQEQRTYR